MAPSIAQTPTVDVVVPVKAASGTTEAKARVRRIVDEEGETTTASYPNYLPVYDYGNKYPPLEPFTHVDHGKDAYPSFKDLLTKGSKIQKLTPTTGSELNKLTAAGKDLLALLVARRKVVAFRDQDLTDLPIQEALGFGGYFGRHHIHPTSGAPEGYPEIHLVHRNNNASVSWHSDVTYEQQPPGTTFLYVLDSPEVGGDTAFVNRVEAYNRLSPALKERLHGLKAVHSGFEQAEFSLKRGGVDSENRASSYSNPSGHWRESAFRQWWLLVTRSIVGLKKEESDALLGFLLAHVGHGIDYQARIRWAPKTVVVWDNRVTAHSAILDWTTGERRHLARITPQAERPYETPYVPKEGKFKA
ncbi:hypothetical protein N7516_008364 [Penicillium verrucosum]|uniref:uncharacterized protein n=1 Tax=Penicillium verrucosum TaxID=60171 RepID=UPI0025452F48|nr:uncharacterized protein N7516_008364 [Penicillium verrucosum]KAJ5926591.1 hypothetical protein N7516_008364 [Penicillium verrucosum]